MGSWILLVRLGIFAAGFLLAIAAAGSTQGDAVRQGQPLVTVVLVKASQDIGAPMDGRIAHILVTEGKTFFKGQSLATLERFP